MRCLVWLHVLGAIHPAAIGMKSREPKRAASTWEPSRQLSVVRRDIGCADVSGLLWKEPTSRVVRTATGDIIVLNGDLRWRNQ
jgi:hypothetical protein